MSAIAMNVQQPEEISSPACPTIEMVHTTETHGKTEEQTSRPYITGWRLHMISAGILLALFISQMESSVTSTAVLVITDELGDYEKSSWLFTAYLLTYSGFPIIWAKLSDILGRKPCLLAALVTFLVFSGTCGGAQTMTQLVVFRSVKGIGGSGVYSLGTLVFWELLPPERWAANASLVTGVLAISLVSGPLIGGAITESKKWRWIFLINIPIILISSALLFGVFPRRLDVEPAAKHAPKTIKSLRRIDAPGCVLLLGFCLLLTTGLQQAALGLPWLSALVLPLPVMATAFLILFLAWSWYVTTKRRWPEPLFPWRFVQNRICLGMIINAFLAGFTFSVTVVQLPQRFMTVNGLSPLAAGVRLLPFGAMVLVGAGASAMIMDRYKVPPTFMCVAGAILQSISLAFLSQVSGHKNIDPSQYGFQIIAGYGNGVVQTAVILLIPYVVESRDLGVGNATLAQFRILGGTIGIATTTAAFTPLVRGALLRFLSPEEVRILLDRTSEIERLSDTTKILVRNVFSDGFNLQMRILIGIAAGHVLATALMWTKPPMRITRAGPISAEN